MQTVSQTDTRRRFSLKAFSFWAAFFSRAAFLIWINLDYFPLICINFNYMRLGEIKFSAFMENFGFAKKFFREISWFFLLRLDFFTFFAVFLMKFDTDSIKLFQFAADVWVQIRINLPQTAAWAAVAYCQKSFSRPYIHPDSINFVPSNNMAQSGFISFVNLR